MMITMRADIAVEIQRRVGDHRMTATTLCRGFSLDSRQRSRQSLFDSRYWAIEP